MCGIAGAYCVENTGDGASKLVHQIVQSQYRRGPDHQGIEMVTGIRGSLTMGANRLSIIDLRPEANQPMWDTEGRCCLVFNGEIYNYLELRDELVGLGHTFATQSDSEVILESFKEWGVRAPERFNGMFAFALYDRADSRLYLFRDRFGVKPLYYFADEGRIYFASTCEAIARYLGLEPNLEYVARGLRTWVYDYGEISPFVGLKALEPSHFLSVGVTDAGRLHVTSDAYYRLDERVTVLTDSLAQKPAQALVELVADLLEDAVDVRFRADVPIGVSLSGGLDSSAIAAMSASGRHGDITGFTFGHPDDARTEGNLAWRLGRQTGIEMHFVNPGMQKIVDAYFKIIDAQGAPFASASGIGQYLVFEAARAQGVKVLLGGQGGDETFMGYRKFFVFYLRRLLRLRRTGEALIFALRMLPTLAAEFRRTSMYWSLRHRYTRSSGVDTVLRLPEVGCEYIGYDPEYPLRVRQMHDVMSVSLPTLLRYEDRNSMGNSVESRLPFLDYRLVEVALALPAAVKLRDGFGKWIVREVVRGRIPEEIRAARYKRGFDVQQSDWIRRGLGPAMREALQLRLPVIERYLEPKAKIDELFSDERLTHRATGFVEATTLIWLGDNAS